MKNRTLLGIGIGIGGTVIAALCCFTPVLVILLGALGLAAWTGYLDFVLFPALALFIGLTLYALYRIQRTSACRETGVSGKET